MTIPVLVDMHKDDLGQRIVKYIAESFSYTGTGFEQSVAMDCESYRHLCHKENPSYLAIRQGDQTLLLRYGLIENNGEKFITVISLQANTDIPLPSEFFKRA